MTLVLRCRLTTWNVRAGSRWSRLSDRVGVNRRTRDAASPESPLPPVYVGTPLGVQHCSRCCRSHPELRAPSPQTAPLQAAVPRPRFPLGSEQPAASRGPHDPRSHSASHQNATRAQEHAFLASPVNGTGASPGRPGGETHGETWGAARARARPGALSLAPPMSQPGAP